MNEVTRQLLRQSRRTFVTQDASNASANERLAWGQTDQWEASKDNCGASWCDEYQGDLLFIGKQLSVIEKNLLKKTLMFSQAGVNSHHILRLRHLPKWASINSHEVLRKVRLAARCHCVSFPFRRLARRRLLSHSGARRLWPTDWELDMSPGQAALHILNILLKLSKSSDRDLVGWGAHVLLMSDLTWSSHPLPDRLWGPEENYESFVLCTGHWTHNHHEVVEGLLGYKA